MRKLIAKYNNQRGQNLMEVLLAMAIFAMISVIAVSSLVNLASLQVRARIRNQASQYAREGMEIAYNLSLQDWTGFQSLSGNYRPALSGNNYVLQGGIENLENGKFTRIIYIEKAHRDANWNIVDSGGSEDPDTVKVTTTVRINANPQGEVKFATFLINLEYVLTNI